MTVWLAKGKFSLRFHLICALILIVIDAIYLDQGVLTFLVALLFFLRVLLDRLLAVFQKRSFDPNNMKRFGIYISCLVAVGFFVKFNNTNARKKAEVVIRAVKAYKAKKPPVSSKAR